MNQSEKEIAHRNAEKSGLSLSEYIRGLVYADSAYTESSNQCAYVAQKTPPLVRDTTGAKWLPDISYGKQQVQTVNRVNTVNGDLIKMAIEGHFDVIIHGCNCYCQMGKGIALTIKRNFPEAYKADCATGKGANEKLGTYSHVEVERDGKLFVVVNAYTQLHWKGKGVKADYNAIRSVMKSVKTDFSGKKIGYPLIGAGLAGGDWDIISQIIEEELEGENHTLVRFMP